MLKLIIPRLSLYSFSDHSAYIPIVLRGGDTLRDQD